MLIFSTLKNNNGLAPLRLRLQSLIMFVLFLSVLSLYFPKSALAADILVDDYERVSSNNSALNSLGMTAASDNTLTYSTVTDAGATTVPGIPAGKPASRVGYVRQGGSSSYWYEPFSSPINLNNYTAIGFFMKIPSTSYNRVPIIIKSGSGGGSQSVANANDYVTGGGGLSTEWRWVQIPITAFTGVASLSAINTIQVAKMTNASGGWASSGWNSDFWIDDLYLMSSSTPPMNTYSMTVSQSGIFKKADGVSTVDITATVLSSGGSPASGQAVTFTKISGNGTLNVTSGTTNSSGVATATYTVGSSADVAKINVAIPNANKDIYIQQDFLDNFELEAFNGARTPIGVGSVGAILSSPVHSGSGAYNLYSSAIQSSSWGIGLERKFTQSINVSSGFSAITAWIRCAQENDACLASIEIQIGDPAASDAQKSKWKSSLFSLTDAYSAYKRIDIPLSESSFTRVDLIDGGGTRGFDLSDIRGMNIIINRNGQTGAHSYYIDDLTFTNPKLMSVSLSSLFMPADGVSKSTVKATVLQGTTPVEGDAVSFALTGSGSLSATSATTNALGEATVEFTAGSNPDLSKITITNATASPSPQTVYVHQGILDNFEYGLDVNGNFLPAGADVGAVDIVDNSVTAPHGGAKSLRLQSDASFTGGYVIQAIKTYNQSLSASGYNAISYYVKSQSDTPTATPATDFTVFIQISMSDANGSIISTWEQSAQHHVTTDYQRVLIPLNGAGFVRAAEGGGTGAFDVSRIKKITFFLNRNSYASGGQHTVYFDDVSFLNDQSLPTVPKYSGLVDDFDDALKYKNNRNDVIILPDQANGGYTDDDGSMGDYFADYVNTPGILDLNWNNVGNSSLQPYDIWYTCFYQNTSGTIKGADLSDNQYVQIRMRGNSSGQKVGPQLVAPSGAKYNYTLTGGDTSFTLATTMTTYNLAMSSFVKEGASADLSSVKNLNLEFRNTNGSGMSQIDQIVVSPYKRANTIEIVEFQPIDSSNNPLSDLHSGDRVRIKLRLKDENNTAISGFGGQIKLSVTNGSIKKESDQSIDYMDGFNASGEATNVFIVKGRDLQDFSAKDVLINVSTAQQINIINNTSNDVSSFDVKINYEGSQEHAPFTMTTFTLQVTAKDAGGLTIDQPLKDITLTSNNGTLVLLSPTPKPDGSIYMDNGVVTIYAYLNNALPTNTQITVALKDNPSIATSSQQFFLKDGTSSEGELAFLNNLIQTSGTMAGVVVGTPGSTRSNTYSNALAVIAFVHKALKDPSPDLSYLAKAEGILNVYKNFSASNVMNDGSGGVGFYDAYDVASGAAVSPYSTSGNDAWFLMAINYYMLTVNNGHTNDGYWNMADKLGIFLKNRQTTSGGFIGGVYSRNTALANNVYVAEHQAESYSGFKYLAEVADRRGNTTKKTTYADAATAVKNFIMSHIYDAGNNRFRTADRNSASGPDNNPSLDAQTSCFMALGPTVDGVNLAPSIAFAVAPYNSSVPSSGGMRMSETYEHRQVEGGMFQLFVDGRSNPPVQHIWIEGSAQLATSLAMLANSPQGTQSDITLHELVAKNIQYVQHYTGGYPTHLGEQKDEWGDIVGTNEIAAAATAWRYFDDVYSYVNPYHPIETEEPPSGFALAVTTTYPTASPDNEVSFTPTSGYFGPLYTDNNDYFKVDYTSAAMAGEAWCIVMWSSAQEKTNGGAASLSGITTPDSNALLKFWAGATMEAPNPSTGQLFSTDYRYLNNYTGALPSQDYLSNSINYIISGTGVPSGTPVSGTVYVRLAAGLYNFVTAQSYTADLCFGIFSQ